MTPHKTARGAAALERLKAFEGIPAPYDKVKRMVIPDALKVLRLQHGHRYCQLGNLASSVGWKHEEAVKELEAKRKVKVRRDGRAVPAVRRRRCGAQPRQQSQHVASRAPRLRQPGQQGLWRHARSSPARHLSLCSPPS